MKTFWLFLMYFFLELAEVCRSCSEHGLITAVKLQHISDSGSQQDTLSAVDAECVPLSGLFRIKAFMAYCLECGYDQSELLDIPLDEVHRLYDAFIAAEA